MAVNRRVLSYALCFVYLTNIVTQCFCDVVSLNHIADPVFNDFRNKIISENQSKVHVSDLSEVIRVRIFGVGLKVLRFQCSNGWVSDISSIKRAGDIVMYPDGGSVAVELPFSFDDLQYYCDSYFLDVPILKISGKLTARVGYNKFDLKVLVGFEEDVCKFHIDRLQVKNLDNIKVNLTGFGIFNKVFNKIVTSVAKSFNEAIRGKIMDELKDALVANVEMAELCYQNKTNIDYFN